MERPPFAVGVIVERRAGCLAPGSVLAAIRSTANRTSTPARPAQRRKRASASARENLAARPTIGLWPLPQRPSFLLDFLRVDINSSNPRPAATAAHRGHKPAAPGRFLYIFGRGPGNVDRLFGGEDSSRAGLRSFSEAGAKACLSAGRRVGNLPAEASAKAGRFIRSATTESPRRSRPSAESSHPTPSRPCGSG